MARTIRGKLGLAASALGATTVLTAGILYFGMTQVAGRLERALAAEARMDHFARLSTQVSSFMIVATEAVQTGLPADVRAERIAPVTDGIGRTFAVLQDDLGAAAEGVRDLDAQARLGTQSLQLARMQAMLGSAAAGLASDSADRERLKAQLDTFAHGFDALLNESVNAELRLRNEILDGIGRLRRGLTTVAVAMAAGSLTLLAGFHFGLVQPQIRRLARLGAAARRIGQEDFAVALPDQPRDEIGALYAETNRMAAALAARRDAVAAEAARLNDIIAERTGALRAANTRLEEIDGNRRRFFADISHELRTPLTVILMETEIGLAQGGDAAKALETIRGRAGRLNRRVDDLLRIARSESGELKLDPAPFALRDMVAEALEETASQTAHAGMAVTVEDLPALTVQGDGNWLRQVVTGLIRNAVRHAGQGGALRVSAGREGDMAVLGITDNGPGIAEADRGRVFDRFAQAGGAAEQGYGMGLAFARWVVEANGGTIGITSPVARGRAAGDAPGTKVTLHLPLAGG